ncbi:hypothetical protein Nepgr_000877 [Nepenthes gracilis]|uniref:Uncharacterized protein n=1 Tax=Nepenthes gracilis TaxID=150966 RepID=A0AAD3P464_NEPGR|nr:hypothetical protein Nepgr_000877 [Nepenthes gracilis]
MSRLGIGRCGCSVHRSDMLKAELEISAHKEVSIKAVFDKRFQVFPSSSSAEQPFFSLAALNDSGPALVTDAIDCVGGMTNWITDRSLTFHLPILGEGERALASWGFGGKMEGRRENAATAAAAVVTVVMILAILAAQATAATTFQQCYIACYVLCAIQPTNTLFSCAFECLRDCIIPPNTTHQTGFHFCNFGCAASHCTNISNPHNPGGKEVEGCVSSCFGVCRKNYLAP